MEQKSKYELEIEKFRHTFSNIKNKKLQYMGWEGEVQRFYQA